MNQPNAKSALIIIDVQNGFCPKGNLPVTNGDAVVPIINHISSYFENIIITQDWHPDHHVSFAENHREKQAFTSIELPYGTQVLWPKHCVQGTWDAELHADLNVPTAQLIIRKGFHADIDSYSAFLEADQTTTTGLEAYLKQRDINTVYLVGLATDFCVAYSALDAKKLGFEVYVIEDACRAIDLNDSLAIAWNHMLNAGINRIQSSDLF